MTELVTGLSVGLGAGIAPGPLLTLVVTSTLQRGFGAGVRVAVAPLLTDAPIIVLAVAVLSAIDDAVVTGLAVAGGVVVIGMGIHTVWTARRVDEERSDTPASTDVWRGVVVNVLSPHPWIYWLTAGGPLLVSAWDRSPLVGVLFLAGFYLMLVGSKVVIALVVARGAARLGSETRSRLLVVGGLLLVVGGGLLIWQAAAGHI